MIFRMQIRPPSPTGMWHTYKCHSFVLWIGGTVPSHLIATYACISSSWFYLWKTAAGRNPHQSKIWIRPWSVLCDIIECARSNFARWRDAVWLCMCKGLSTFPWEHSSFHSIPCSTLGSSRPNSDKYPLVCFWSLKCICGNCRGCRTHSIH